MKFDIENQNFNSTTKNGIRSVYYVHIGGVNVMFIVYEVKSVCI